MAANCEHLHSVFDFQHLGSLHVLKMVGGLNWQLASLETEVKKVFANNPLNNFLNPAVNLNLDKLVCKVSERSERATSTTKLSHLTRFGSLVLLLLY